MTNSGFAEAGSFVKPGAVGRIIRLLAGALLLLIVWRVVLNVQNTLDEWEAQRRADQKED